MLRRRTRRQSAAPQAAHQSALDHPADSPAGREPPRQAVASDQVRVIRGCLRMLARLCEGWSDANRCGGSWWIRDRQAGCCRPRTPHAMPAGRSPHLSAALKRQRLAGGGTSRGSPRCPWFPIHRWGRRRPLIRDRPCRLGLLGSGQADQGELSLGVAAGAALQTQDTADVRQVDPACRRCRSPTTTASSAPQRCRPRRRQGVLRTGCTRQST
jgi:hypothetical protein